MKVKNECQKQRRNAKFTATPFAVIALYFLISLRGDWQIILFMLFMMPFFMFFGMFLAYDGILTQLKKKEG